MEEFLAGFYLCDELISIAETVCNGYPERCIAGSDLKCLDALKTANAALGDLCQGFVGHITENMANNSLGNTAGDAENDACSGVGSKGSIGLRIGYFCKVNAGFLYHAHKLLGSEHEVNKPFAVLDKLGAGSLCLFSRARHNCDGNDLLICVLLTDERAEHLHRGAAGRNLRHEVRVLVFNMLYPARAAGGEHGELCTALELLKELCRFLHDGEVCGERGVKHIVNAHHLECGDYLAHHGNAGGNTEFLAYADANCRSDLDCNLLAGVVDSLPHIGDLVFNR